MSQQANTVFHYECATKDRYVVMSPKGNIPITGGSFTTSEKKIADAIESSKGFKLGRIWRSDGVILGSNKKTVSGMRGTRLTKPKDLSPEEKIAQMQLMELPAEVIEAARQKLGRKQE